MVSSLDGSAAMAKLRRLVRIREDTMLHQDIWYLNDVDGVRAGSTF